MQFTSLYGPHSAARKTVMERNVQDPFVQFTTIHSTPSSRARRVSVDQWIKHEQTITQLYTDQKKTLEEVVNIMRQEHGFHAT